ncbi:hypothetical protein BX666DRAFT_1939243, partial [Dichotomocladium elegans]
MDVLILPSVLVFSYFFSRLPRPAHAIKRPRINHYMILLLARTASASRTQDHTEILGKCTTGRISYIWLSNSSKQLVILLNYYVIELHYVYRYSLFFFVCVCVWSAGSQS